MKVELGPFWTLLLGGLAAMGNAQAEVALYGALGDSITAATFADRELSAAIRGDAATEIPKWIPFLGNKENRYTYSWATGSNVGSHADRLRILFSERARELKEVNLSVPGEKAAGLLEQIENLKWELGSAAARLEYVTLWIGANDACQSTGLDAFRASLDAAFDSLGDVAPGESVRVLVPGLPKIPDLGRKEILEARTATGLTCRQLRDGMLKFCNPLTVWSTPAEYEARMATTHSYHRAIEEAVERANRLHRGLDVTFVDEIFREDFKASDLAQDCFHPNARGQARLSEIFWKAQAW